MTRVRPLLVLLMALLVALPAAAERADDAKRKSKNGKAEATIDGVTVTLEYGRPHVKKRQVWGDLVPYDKVWRTGADEATTVTFSEAVTIEGQALDAGTYALFTIPGEGKWTVIFNKQAEQWGAFKYEAEQDALRVHVVAQAHEHVEEMDFVIEDSTIMLRWEKLAVPFSFAKR